MHILRGLLKALDQFDAVIALIRASASAEEARGGLMELLDIDEVQATAILDMQLRRLAALERQRIIDEHARSRRRSTTTTTSSPGPAANVRSSRTNWPRSSRIGMRLPGRSLPCLAGLRSTAK